MFLFPLVAFVQISTMLDELATQFEFFFLVCGFWLGGSLRRGATKHKVTTFFLFVAWQPLQDRPADASGPAVAPP